MNIAMRKYVIFLAVVVSHFLYVQDIITFERCHKKTCPLGFLTRPDTNRPAQLQKRLEISDLGSRVTVWSM